MTFFDEKDGSESTVSVPVGTNLLEAAHNNEVDLEGGLSVADRLVATLQKRVGS